MPNQNRELNITVERGSISESLCWLFKIRKSPKGSKLMTTGVWPWLQSWKAHIDSVFGFFQVFILLSPLQLFTHPRSFSAVTLIRNTIRHERAERRFCSSSHVPIENAAHDSRSYRKKKTKTNASFLFGFNVFRGWCYNLRRAFKDRCLLPHWASFHIIISQRSSCSSLRD